MNALTIVQWCLTGLFTIIVLSAMLAVAGIACRLYVWLQGLRDEGVL